MFFFSFAIWLLSTVYFVFFGGGVVNQQDVGSLGQLLNELAAQTIYLFLVLLEFGVLCEACHADYNLPTCRTHLLNKIGANFKLNLFHYKISKYSSSFGTFIFLTTQQAVRTFHYALPWQPLLNFLLFYPFLLELL